MFGPTIGTTWEKTEVFFKRICEIERILFTDKIYTNNNPKTLYLDFIVIVVEIVSVEDSYSKY